LDGNEINSVRSKRAAVLETVNRGQGYALVGVIYPKVTFIFFVI